MSVAHTSYQRSIPMPESTAREIARRTELFGYAPDVVPVNGQGHLSICSDADAKVVSGQVALIEQASA